MYWLHVALLTLGTFWTEQLPIGYEISGNEHEIDSKAEKYDAKVNYEEVKAYKDLCQGATPQRARKRRLEALFSHQQSKLDVLYVLKCLNSLTCTSVSTSDS